MAHILLVEDDADSRDALRFLLEHSGHRVSVAGDGREAIALAASLVPDWAVIDIGLPDIDGYEAARGVRAGAPAVHMVALTGYGRPEDRQRAFDAGFDAHMMKPVDPDQLVEMITPR
jgi:CheY-like chemotaxis protein